MTNPHINPPMEKPSRGVTSKLLSMWQHIKKDRQFLILLIPCIVFYIIFRYGPIYGVIIAFKDFNVYDGFFGSDWVGLKHFETFFSSPDFWLLFRNTFLLGIYTLLIAFPFPILFALLLNEVKHQLFKKTVQTISLLPYLLSIVVIISMLTDLLSPSRGLINQIIAAFGFEKIHFLIKPEWFRTLYVSSDIWASMGYTSIIYLAAIAGIDPTLYEAARVDGAKRWHMMRYVTLPSLIPTILVLFILSTGNLIKIGYEKILLMYNPMTYSVADVFSTYVYRKGLLERNYSFATAVGLFESVIALILLTSANLLSRRFGGNSLW